VCNHSSNAVYHLRQFFQLRPAETPSITGVTLRQKGLGSAALTYLTMTTCVRFLPGHHHAIHLHSKYSVGNISEYWLSVSTTESLIFIGPCIVIYSYSTTNKKHLLSQIIYSCKTLYIFRTVFLSIIRSSKLRLQQRFMSNSCCYLLLSGMKSHSR
jgi:hypothetical protein